MEKDKKSLMRKWERSIVPTKSCVTSETFDQVCASVEEQRENYVASEIYRSTDKGQSGEIVETEEVLRPE